MRQFDRRRGSAHHDMLVAPVKLRHIAGRKEQQHKRFRAPGPNIRRAVRRRALGKSPSPRNRSSRRPHQGPSDGENLLMLN